MIIESRHNEALKDPTLLTNQSFSECKELHPSSKRALVEDMGLQTMTEVQAKTFAAALAGRDVLVRSKTGTGKTLAFLVPAVERLVSIPTYVPGGSVRCLIVAPTRELALQIGHEAEKLLSHHSDLSLQVMYGGTKMARDMNAMNQRLPSILVATPGRLLDHLQKTSVRGRKFSDDILAKTNIVVLDEIDRLLDMGFRREVQKILSYLPRTEKRQTMLFSATLPQGLKPVMQESMKDDYLEVDCVMDNAERTPTNLRVTQSHVVLPRMDSVIPAIYSILKEATLKSPSKVVVFFPTARMVSFFADLYSGFRCPIIELHSKKSQSSRNTATASFRRAKNAILFTSDVSARGIDYPDVTHVVQVGIPESREQYIHRLGRTARAGKEGKGLLVLFPFESRFLSELRGLEVPRDRGIEKMLPERPAESEIPEWMAQNLSRIRSGGNKLASSAELAYLAFLGYYLGQANRVRLDKSDVVQVSNDFSRAIGLSYVPSIPRQLISKMELGGVHGLLVKDTDS